MTQLDLRIIRYNWMVFCPIALTHQERAACPRPPNPVGRNQKQLKSHAHRMSQVSLVSPSFAILQLLLGASWEAPGFCLQLRGGLAQVKWAISSWKARSRYYCPIRAIPRAAHQICPSTLCFSPCSSPWAPRHLSQP